MTIALITHAAAVGTTSGVDTTGANLIVLAASYDSGATISDSKGNTWTALTARSPNSVNSFSRLYYCFNPTVGTGHTFTVSIGYGCIFMQAYSGVAMSPFDAESGGTATSSTMASAGTLNPASNNELIVSCLSVGAGTGQSVDSGMSITNTLDPVYMASYGGSMAYKIQTTAASISPIFSWTGSDLASAGSASFFEDSGGIATAMTATLPTPNIVPRGINLTTTLGVNGTYTGTVTLSDNGGGGTFGTAPIWSGESSSKNFTYQNTSPGAYVITVTPSGITSPADFPVIIEKTYNIVCEGDSLTRGDHCSSGAGTTSGTCYPGVLNALLQAAASPALITISNNGVSSRQLSQMLIDQDYIPSYVAGADLNVCIIMGGTNDIYDLAMGSDTPEQAAATTYQRLLALCADVRANGYKVLVFTLATGTGILPPTFDLSRSLFNDNIRKNWKSFADGIIDLGACAPMGWRGASTNLTYFYSDNVHFSDTGYAVLSNTALPEVRGVLLGASGSSGTDGGGGTTGGMSYLIGDGDGL